MNTVAKGDSLETEVFQLLQRLIDDGDFYAQKELCRLRKKPRYYSHIHLREIEFDLGVEIWMPNASQASLICPIECKNYAQSVPGNDIAEFTFNFQAVGAHKGLVVSRSAFQRGALNIAKSKGLGLIRYFGNDNHKWILHRSTAANVVSARADDRIVLAKMMSDEACHPPVIDAVCETANGVTTSLWEFFDDLLDNPSSPEWLRVQSPIKQFGGVVPYIEADKIENLAISAAALDCGALTPIDLDLLCSGESQRSGLKIQRFTSENLPNVLPSVLGRFRFNENTIELFDAHAHSTEQMRFTLAHELGHHFLRHGQYLALDICDDDDVEDRIQPLINLTDISRLEWQANHFASCLLMAKRPFLRWFRQLLDELNIKEKGYGVLYVDSQPCNQASFGAICSDLARTFQVSFSAVNVRLKKLGLLNDQRASSGSISP